MCMQIRSVRKVQKGTEGTENELVLHVYTPTPFAHSPKRKHKLRGERKRTTQHNFQLKQKQSELYESKLSIYNRKNKIT